MKNKIIKWGIIGPGKIANKFATDLATVKDAELVAVASRSQDKANEFSKKFNVKKAYDSYFKLAQDDELDAVYIATPHSFHKEHAILCLQNKKAVLCEKPFAMNKYEVEEMIKVAKKNNVLLMEALWTYFLPHYNYILDVIKHDKFGKLLELKADFGFVTPFDESSRLFKKEVGGGSLLDIGIYPIFAALSTLGLPEKINAKATFFDNGADSSCDMIFNYKNVTANLKSTLIKNTPTEAIFTFEKATIRINTMFHMPTNITLIKKGVEQILDFNYTTFGYNFETEHFNNLIRTGKKESDIMTFDFSRNLINTLDKVREIIGLKYKDN